MWPSPCSSFSRIITFVILWGWEPSGSCKFYATWLKASLYLPVFPYLLRASFWAPYLLLKKKKSASYMETEESCSQSSHLIFDSGQNTPKAWVQIPQNIISAYSGWESHLHSQEGVTSCLHLLSLFSVTRAVAVQPMGAPSESWSRMCPHSGQALVAMWLGLAAQPPCPCSPVHPCCISKPNHRGSYWPSPWEWGQLPERAFRRKSLVIRFLWNHRITEVGKGF